MTGDALSIIEAAYDLWATDEVWVHQLVAAAAPHHAGLALGSVAALVVASPDVSEPIVAAMLLRERVRGSGASPTREQVREAAVAVDRAHATFGSRDPIGALETWREVARGRCPVLDEFSRDGRRFFVTRGDEASSARNRALSAREREVARSAAQGLSDKEIAFDLGLSRSTVATLLQRACRKLGLRSRLTLAAFEW